MGGCVTAASEWKWMSIVAAAGLRAGLKDGEAHDSMETRSKIVN